MRFCSCCDFVKYLKYHNKIIESNKVIQEYLVWKMSLSMAEAHESIWFELGIYSHIKNPVDKANK